VTRLLLVRHGLAMPPGDHRLPGPDVALLPAGEDQARKLAIRLRDFEPSAVSTSDTLRSRQTGEIIAATCGLPCQAIQDLRELDFGAWGGRTYADVVVADPAASTWFADPEASAPPGGESIAAAAERVARVLRTMADRDARCVAVVGHAGSLRLAVARVLGMPLSSYWRLRMECASLSVLEWTADGPTLERWNDVTHLEPDPVTPDRRPWGKDAAR
jgi:ribonuclease H / adenosylcobalamin/alpha-ribazole phosphatase